MQTEGPGARAFTITTPAASRFSLSRSQYGVLGVWAAAQSGRGGVQRRIGPRSKRPGSRRQEADGGWRYQPRQGRPARHAPASPPSASRRCSSCRTSSTPTAASTAKTRCEIPADREGHRLDDEELRQGRQRDEVPPRLPQRHALRRRARRRRRGAEVFRQARLVQEGGRLPAQAADEERLVDTGGFTGTSPTRASAIIFLSPRPRAGASFNKLDWVADDKAAAGAWNRRPRDVANVTRWIGRASEREFNWQIMTLDAPIEDWHDAPILYLSGSDPLKIGKAHVDEDAAIRRGGRPDPRQRRLRQGRVRRQARRSWRRSCSRRTSSASCPSRTRSTPTLYPRSKWKNKPSVLGVSNGVRELMLLIPQADPGKDWQLGVSRGREDRWQLAANIVVLRRRPAATSASRARRTSSPKTPRSRPTASLKLARLKYKGNWDPEPGGWRRLRNLLRNDDKLDLDRQARRPRLRLARRRQDRPPHRHHQAQARRRRQGAAQEVHRRRRHAARRRGGRVGAVRVVDRSGARGRARPGGKLEPLPADHPLLGGKDGVKVAYRPFAQKVVAGKGNVPRSRRPRRRPPGGPVQPRRPERRARRPPRRRHHRLPARDGDGARPPDRAGRGGDQAGDEADDAQTERCRKIDEGVNPCCEKVIAMVPSPVWERVRVRGRTPSDMFRRCGRTDSLRACLAQPLFPRVRGRGRTLLSNRCVYRERRSVHVRDLVREQQRLGVLLPGGQRLALDDLALVADRAAAAAASSLLRHLGASASRASASLAPGAASRASLRRHRLRRRRRSASAAASAPADCRNSIANRTSVRPRRALEQHLVQRRHAAGVVLRVEELRPARHLPRHVHRHRAVHEEQRLLRDDRASSAGCWPCRGRRSRTAPSAPAGCRGRCSRRRCGGCCRARR